jgi:hypothetical protein
MEINKFTHNLKNFDYFKKNIRLTCISDTVRKALLGITIMFLVLESVLTISDAVFGIYGGKFWILMKNKRNIGIFTVLLLVIIIGILILTQYSKKALNNSYKKVHGLYLENPQVFKSRKVYKRKKNALCVLAELPEEQEYLEKIMVKLFYENKTAEKTAYNFLAVSHGKKESLKTENFKKQVVSCDKALENRLFTFDRFRDNDEDNNYAYYVNINGCNIKINDDKAVLAEIVLS